VPTPEAIQDALTRAEAVSRANAGKKAPKTVEKEAKEARMQALYDLLPEEGDALHRDTDPLSKSSAVGDIDPSNPVHMAILRESGFSDRHIATLLEGQRRQGEGVYLRQYQSAEQEGIDTGEGLSHTGEKRKGELAASKTGQTKGQREGAATKQDKAVTILGTTANSRGVNFSTFDHDKFLNNVDEVLKAAQAAGIKTGTEGKTGEALDRAITMAFNAVAHNHRNGYAGDGSKPLIAFPDNPIEVNPDARPVKVDPTLAQVINMALHDRGARPPKEPKVPKSGVVSEFDQKRYAQGDARSKDALSIARRNAGLATETGETNALRAQLEAAGFTADRILKSPFSELRPDFVDGGIHDTPTPGTEPKNIHASAFTGAIEPLDLTSSGIPSSRLTRAGFLPEGPRDAAKRRIEERAKPSAKAAALFLPENKDAIATIARQSKTREEFTKAIKNAPAPRQNNVMTEPYRGEWKTGELFKDDYGADPFIYESRDIDPKMFGDLLKLEGEKYETVVNMPTTQKYIEWYKNGEVPPPITVIKRASGVENEGKYVNTDRRRVVAAIEAGVKTIPALVEIGRSEELWRTHQGASFLPEDKPESRRSPKEMAQERIAKRKDSVKINGKSVSTGTPITFKYLRNTESATKLHGRPTKESPFDRGYEPSGRYMTVLEGKVPEGKQFETGEVEFKNPIVLPVGKYGETSWKRILSEQFGGKTGKKLSQAIIDAGHDGVITTGQDRAGNKYTSEILDLTTFDYGKAKYLPEDARDIVPAIKINGKLVKGEKGDTHQDILDRHMAENPDDVDALMDFDTKANPNRFVGPDGQEITREQLKERFGVVDSQGLRKLQIGEGRFLPESPANGKNPREAARQRTATRQRASALKIAAKDRMDRRRELQPN